MVFLGSPKYTGRIDDSAADIASGVKQSWGKKTEEVPGQQKESVKEIVRLLHAQERPVYM